MRCYSLAYLLWMDLPVRKMQRPVTLLGMVPEATGASPRGWQGRGPHQPGPVPPLCQEQGRREAAMGSPRSGHWALPWGWGQAKAGRPLASQVGSAWQPWGAGDRRQQGLTARGGGGGPEMGPGPRAGQKRSWGSGQGQGGLSVPSALTVSRKAALPRV